MVDLVNLPLPKQDIQLRMYLSLETQCVLEHTLQISCDSMLTVEQILGQLQDYVKSQGSEALQRRAFSTCRQAEGETSAEFFVRLKSLCEEIDVCAAHGTECGEKRVKHETLLGVRDENLVQRLIVMPVPLLSGMW